MPGSFGPLLRVACIVLGIVGVAVPQTPDTATIQGTVVDQSRAPVGDADVTVTASSISLRRNLRTGPSGNFTFSGLPAGVSVSVVVQKSGFSDAKSGLIPLNGGATASVN